MSKLDLTKPVQLRDGRKARIICTDRVSDHYPVLALIPDTDGKEYSESYTVEGKLYTHGSGNSQMDLVNVPERHSIFLNIYKTGNVCQHSTLSGAQIHHHSPSEGDTIEVIHADGKFVEVINHG